jgi:Cys-rich repeat protein
MPSAKLVIGLTAIATTLMVPGLGRAQSCTSDADCAKGLTCQADPVVQTGAAVCTIVDGGTVCTEMTLPPPPPTSSCKAAPCTSVADCGPDMVCNSQTYTTCTGGTPVAVRCAPDADCPVAPAPDPVSCTDTTSAQCAYRWEMPCNADADCGAGFTCQPTMMGMCSGSSGTASGSSGGSSEGVGGGTGSTAAPVAVPVPADVDAGVAVPPTCTTVATYPGYCQAKPTVCAADADCPAGWTCTAANSGTTVSTEPATAPAAPIGGAGGATSDPIPPDLVRDAGVAVPIVEAPRVCQPPSTHGTTYKGQDLGGSETASIPTRSADAGATQGNTVPPSPTAPVANTPGTTQTVATTSGGGGCTVAAGELSSAPAWLLFAALGLLLARRGRKS